MFGTLSLTVALTVAACGSSNNDKAGTPSNTTPKSTGGNTATTTVSGTLNGSGSTAQQAAMQAWQTGFQTANTGTTVNYNPIGSGGGVTAFLQKAVTFAGSDAALSGSQIQQAKTTCNGDYIEIPVYVDPIAIVYNLPGVSKLTMSASTVAQVFAGKITTWNDPAIAKENPGVTLPSTTITPVHRSDESGTTANFTDYLSQAAKSDWSYGSIEDWPIKSGEGADGTSGVIAAVKAGNGTIGYADNSQAGTLGKVSVLVGTTPTAPSATAAGAVLDQSSAIMGGGRPATDLAMTVNRTPSGSGVYPVILVSYQIMCQQQSSSATAALVKAFETYVVSSAGQQSAAQQAGSAPIPASLQAKDLAAINTIK
jgi:phosphate transport system substrate-binding protein